MRKIYNYIFAAAAMTAALTACQKEMDSPVNDETPDAVKVVVSLSDDMAKAFTDEGGVQWAVGDQIKFSSGEFFSEALTAEDISEDGYTAEFTFPVKGEGDGADWINKVDRTGWFCSSTTHPTNYTEVEYTLGVDNGNMFTQDVAGEMNRRYLFLHSGTGLTRITADQTPEVKMDIIGSIFRIIPYTQTYNNEKVLSVKLESGTKLVATVGYDRGAGTYSQTDWKAYKNIQVSLGTPFSLEGVTSAEASKGIYMAVAATLPDVPLAGYKYIVETDVATYTFDAMDKSLVVAENMVKNVMLNLDNADDRFVESGLLRYVGGITAELSFGADPVSGVDAGYWYAETQLAGEDAWTKRVNAENASYYSNVVFNAVDNATGEPATWVRVVYGGNEGCHWMISADANTGEARSATVTATFPNVKGYVVTDECKTKSITVNQAAAGSVREYAWGAVGNTDLTFTADAYTDWRAPDSYYCLAIGGQNIESFGDDKNNEQALYSTVTMTAYVLGTAIPGGEVASWITIDYQKDGEGRYIGTHPIISVEANNSSAERKALVYINVTGEVPEGYEWKGAYKQFMVTQAGRQIEVVADLNQTYTGTVPAEGEEMTLGTLALTIDGEAQADVAAAMAQYGVTISVNNGAEVIVAADGSVAMTIPANPYKNGGKEYTVTVKHDGKTLETAVINQEEGSEEGGEESLSCPYTYDLYGNREWNTGWGFGPNIAFTGHWGRIENVKLNGEDVTLTPEIAEEVVAFALRSTAPTPEERDAVIALGDRAYSETAVVAKADTGFLATVPNVIYITFATGEPWASSKVTGYDSDGNELGYWIVWTD